jgi:hypothetical protein
MLCIPSEKSKYWTGQKKGEKVKSKHIWHEKEIRFRSKNFSILLEKASIVLSPLGEKDLVSFYIY